MDTIVTGSYLGTTPQQWHNKVSPKGGIDWIRTLLVSPVAGFKHDHSAMADWQRETARKGDRIIDVPLDGKRRSAKVGFF